MQLYTRILSSGIFFLAFAFFTRAQETQVLPQESQTSTRFARVDSLLDSYASTGRIIGGVALLARDGNIQYTKSFGLADRETQKPMEPDALFRIASMTKAITVVATMLLYEEGHFELDDPIAKFIPEFSEMQVMVLDSTGDPYSLEPARSPITIRHLLNHTSGLTYRFWNQPYIADTYQKNHIYNGLDISEGTVGDMVKRLAHLPLVHHPGEGWQYGLNMDVLGYLIEILSGQTFEGFLYERLLVPLGMKDTYFYLPPEKEKRLVKLYAEDPEGNLVRVEGESPDQVYADYPLHARNQDYFAGGGGLVSTAQDYFRFLQMLLNRGSLNGQQILSPATATLITSEQTGDRFNWWPGHGFGFGFAISRGSELSGDPSGKGTFRWLGYLNTHFWADPETGVVGVYLTQTKVELGADEFKAFAYRALDK